MNTFIIRYLSKSSLPTCSKICRYSSLIYESKVTSRDKFGSNIIKLNDHSDKESGGRSNKKKKFDASSLLLLVVPGSAFALGCWQFQRLQWKLDLIKELEEKTTKEAIEFPIHDIEHLEKYEYQKVKLRGEFLPSKEFVIAPRGRFDKGYKHKKAGLAGDAQSSSHGGHVITPFKIENTNHVVMVNRGWLSQSQLQSIPPPPSSKVVVEAVIRKSENRPQFVGENIPERNVWYYRNFEEMANHCDALPVYLEATFESSQRNGPIGGQTNVTVRNEHLNYLLTWFSLSAITTAMWYFKFCR
uniref:SURF1-like protein n=1 Tax=Panagrolaimus superbus TaxID=310955 RepID=A0A914YWP3_9BILA